MSHNDNGCKPQRYTPIKLGSTILINALYTADHHILDLEQLVQEQQDKIKALKDEIYNYQCKERQAVYDNVGRTLASILDNSKGMAPVNEGISIDTVLILKHLGAIISGINDGSTHLDDGYSAIEKYVTDALERAAQVSEALDHREVSKDILEGTGET